MPNTRHISQTHSDRLLYMKIWASLVTRMVKNLPEMQISVQFSSVAPLCPTLCDPMDCSVPGFPVLHYLLEFAQTHTLSWWCHPTIALSSSIALLSSCPQSFPASGSFPMSWLFASGGQSTRALASILPMNIQGWFPLGWTGLISLLSKELSVVFSSITVWKHQFFDPQPSLWSNTHIHTWILEKP